MRIEVPVTPYVFKYIVHKYGGGHHDLTESRRHTLRLAFEHMRMGGEMVPLERKALGRHIELDIGSDHVLKRLYRHFEPLLRAGGYFHHQFMERMLMYVQDQEDLAQILDLRQSEWNREMALRTFLQKYQITEIDWSYDSASRQLRRLIRPLPGYNQHKDLKAYIDRKFQFRPATDPKVRWISGYKEAENPGELFSQQEDMVRMCSVVHGESNPSITFAAYSRYHQGLVAKTIRVPDSVVASDTIHDYTDQVCRIINQYLLDGYTII